MYKQKLSKPKAKHHSRLLSLHAFWVQKSLTLLLASSELCVPEDEEVQRTTRPQCLRVMVSEYTVQGKINLHSSSTVK